MKKFKKYLKSLDEEHLKKLFKVSGLSDLEYWVLYYGIIKKRLVINTCMKLNISRAYYFILQGKAIIKVYFTVNKLEKI